MIQNKKVDFNYSSKLDILLDLSTIGWWEIDLKTRVYKFSEAICNLLGLKNELTHEDEILKYIRDDYRLIFRSHLNTLETGRSYEYVYPLILNKETIWIRSVFMFTKEGEKYTVFGVLCFVKDPAFYNNDTDLIKKLNSLIIQQTNISNSLREILSTDDISSVVNKILAGILDQFDAQRAYIMKCDWSKRVHNCIFEAVPRPELAEIDNLKNISFEDTKWWLDTLSESIPILLSTLDEIPEEHTFEKEILEAQDIKSLMVVPLILKDRLWGYAGVDLVDSYRSWSQLDYLWFSSLMTIICLCLELRESELLAKEAVEAYERNERLMYKTFVNLPVGLAIYDGKGDLILNNDKNIELFFLNSGKVPTESIFSLGALNFISDQIKNREEVTVQWEFDPLFYDITGKSKINLITKVNYIYDKDGSLLYYIIINIDNTEQKILEEKLVKAKEKAEELDRLKSAFLANMSHEIRTPLNAIVGFSRIISETDDQDERMEYFKVVEENNDLLLRLISDILDLSKIETGNLDFVYGDINLNILCSDIQKTYLVKDTGDNKILFDITSPEYYIYSDRNRVTQVITNFINNALKFTSGGSITIAYRPVEDNFIEISVTDTGIGIPPDKVNDVFKRFTKLNSFVQGTGLGLSISQSIVEQFGGTIGVDSELGVGSKFWFTHPLK